MDGNLSQKWWLGEPINKLILTRAMRAVHSLVMQMTWRTDRLNNKKKSRKRGNLASSLILG